VNEKLYIWPIPGQSKYIWDTVEAYTLGTDLDKKPRLNDQSIELVFKECIEHNGNMIHPAYITKYLIMLNCKDIEKVNLMEISEKYMRLYNLIKAEESNTNQKINSEGAVMGVGIESLLQNPYVHSLN